MKAAVAILKIYTHMERNEILIKKSFKFSSIQDGLGHF
jgi:hypothetical protein